MARGLSLVTAGCGLVADRIVKDFGAEVPPSGFVTVTSARDSAVVMSDARILALSCEIPRKAVVRLCPFHRTTDPDTKYDPPSTRSKSGPPAITNRGCRLEITGTGF
jgi:hypothetical protein